MKRLTIALDDIARIQEIFGTDAVDPIRYGILCETYGADGLTVTLSHSSRGIQEKDIRLLKELRRSYLNLHIPFHTDLFKLALSIAPDMVTFVEISSSNPDQLLPLSTAILNETLAEVLPDFQANNISVAVLIAPDINVLKSLSKLEIDYVELDCSEYTRATDTNDQLVALDNLKTAAMGAAKLGLGINCFGNIGYSHLADLVQIPHLEDITMGKSLIHRAFLVGLEKAIQEARLAISGSA
ncbi:MAG: pyridoxine 5'-phosphate synthase [Calditrichaeota bacterium]|nr:pyridoxine 5'-phosphate synthase [Calditrichota bacterium]